MKLYPLLFQPNLHTVVWGGNRLCPYKGLPASTQSIGESWEVSAVPSSKSIVANGEWAGQDLVSVIAQAPEDILGNPVYDKYHELPLLAKFIDAKRDLSIQVHPNDEMARRVHGKMGKSEMWYVIDAEPGSYLYAGFKTQITNYEFKKRIEDGTITADTAGSYLLTNQNLRFTNINWTFFIAAGALTVVCLIVYIAVKKRYWFW